LVHPSLHLIDSVSAANASTLVQVIAHGVDRTVGRQHTFMPPFRTDLDDGQIAALANFVRTGFGGVSSDLDESDVAAILRGGTRTSWLIRDAKPLAVSAIVALPLVAWLAAWQGWHAFARRRARDKRMGSPRSVGKDARSDLG
jgi:hypothetical protein